MSVAPPDWPPRDDDIRAALDAAWRDGSWGKYHGGHVERLEAALAAYHGVKHCLTCGSGTFAVELALRALKVGPADEVILAAYDYPGNFLSVHAVGATPVLIDVQASDWQLDPQRVAAAIGPATKAVIASHLHGGLVAMPALRTIADRHGLTIVEDACQSPGALVKEGRAGTWGDVGVLSFGGSKLLTAGRGGALLTNDNAIHQRAKLWQNRANVVCPLSELQALVLLPQLEKLDARNAQRLDRVRLLRTLLADVPGLRLLANEASPAFYKVGFQLDTAAFGVSRDQLTSNARAAGVALDEGFRALHVGRSPSRYRAGGTLTEAERAQRDCVILHHPVLMESAESIEEVARVLVSAR